MKMLYKEKTSYEILQNYLSTLIKTCFKGFYIFFCLGAAEYAFAALVAHYVHLREKKIRGKSFFRYDKNWESKISWNK